VVKQRRPHSPRRRDKTMTEAISDKMRPGVESEWLELHKSPPCESD
jgi:hypothetical protein